VNATDADEARQLCMQAGAALWVAGQGDLVWGHVGVRDPLGRGIWIKKPGWGLEETTPENVQLVSFEAEVLAGEGKPHAECHIHLEILRSQPELACTVHTHAVPSVAFAALDVPLLPLSHDGALFGGADVPRFEPSGALINTPELGRRLAVTLGDAPGALLPAHGLVAAGPTVAAAVMHAVLLDRACALQLRAMPGGAPRAYPNRKEAAAKRFECWTASQLNAGWEYLLRRAAQSRPTQGTPA
jgi:ribulose-5-phosphate 4-epimerase/fuculose-1-phosphate aldolase